MAGAFPDRHRGGTRTQTTNPGVPTLRCLLHHCRSEIMTIVPPKTHTRSLFCWQVNYSSEETYVVPIIHMENTYSYIFEILCLCRERYGIELSPNRGHGLKIMLIHLNSNK